MTREEILNSRAGIDMNLLIAEHVLGWMAWKEQRGEYTHVIFQQPGERAPYMRSQQWKTVQKRYEQIPFSEIDRMKHIVSGLKDWSTDISAAWEVSEKVPCIQLQRKINGDYVVRWGSYSEKDRCVTAQTAPEAICKAALLAILPGEE